MTAMIGQPGLHTLVTFIIGVFLVWAFRQTIKDLKK